MAKKSPYVHEHLDGDEDGILRDGERRTVPMMIKDAAARSFGHDDSLALHKPGQRFSADAAARARVEEARAEGIREMCDAWKRKPVADVAGEYRGAQEGDVCTVREGGVDEGSPGHLRMVKGKLTCVPDKRNQDAVSSRTMTMDEAQRIRDRAWLESVQELEQAWKR